MLDDRLVRRFSCQNSSCINYLMNSSFLPLKGGREGLILKNPSRSQHTCVHCSFPGFVKEDRVSLVLGSTGLSQ
jgi:hypothetical protein